MSWHEREKKIRAAVLYMLIAFLFCVGAGHLLSWFWRHMADPNFATFIVSIVVVIVGASIMRTRKKNGA